MSTVEDLKNRTPQGFGVTVETLTPTDQDIRVLSAQLGRTVRDVIEIPARCVCGNPLVAATAPRLSNGSPFPTVFYLAHPAITAAASRLEAGGLMYEMTDALAADPELASRYTLAHENYLAERERIRLISGTDEVPEIENISAGGMPTRVKCLHAVIGHTLAVGRGINPMGDWGLDEITDWWTPQVCACEPSWRDA
jgi:septum formation initiator family protein